MAITGDALAKAAREAYIRFKGEQIPNMAGGTTPKGFDASGFIDYCFAQCGAALKQKGTNDLFRKPYQWKETLENTRANHMTLDGAIAFIVKDDGGEVPQGYTDGRGNADCAGIVSNNMIIYYSSTNKAILETRINSTTRKDWWSHFVLLRNVEFDIP